MINAINKALSSRTDGRFQLVADTQTKHFNTEKVRIQAGNFTKYYIHDLITDEYIQIPTPAEAENWM